MTEAGFVLSFGCNATGQLGRLDAQQNAIELKTQGCDIFPQKLENNFSNMSSPSEAKLKFDQNSFKKESYLINSLNIIDEASPTLQTHNIHENSQTNITNLEKTDNESGPHKFIEQETFANFTQQQDSQHFTREYEKKDCNPLFDQLSNFPNNYKSSIPLSKNASQSFNITKKCNPDENQMVTDDDASKMRKYIDQLEKNKSDISKIDDTYKSLTNELTKFFDKIKGILSQDLYGNIYADSKRFSDDQIYLKTVSNIENVIFDFLNFRN